MLLKYAFRAAACRPYAAIGYAPRTMSGSSHSVGVAVDYYGKVTPYDGGGPVSYDVTHGVVAGGGVEFGRGRFRVAPEVRYTHWNKDPVNIFRSHGYHVAGKQDEVSVLVGLSWR